MLQQKTWQSLIGIEFCDPTIFEAPRQYVLAKLGSSDSLVCNLRPVIAAPCPALDGVLGM